MPRKILSLITATLLIFGLLPLGAAFASAEASANLDAASQKVFPGQRQMTVTVRNNEVGSLPGLNTVGARAINWIRVVAPHGQGFTLGEPTQAPGNWKVSEDRLSNLQAVTFYDSTLAAQAQIQLPLSINVAAPSNCDRPARFVVQVSSDRGDTVKNATGSLDSVVRALRLDGAAVVSPAGAADGTGSGGQTVTWGVTVTNFAANALTLKPTLAVPAGDEIVTDAAPALVQPGQTRQFDFGVRLGEVTSDTNKNYSANAARSDGACATENENFGYRIEVPPTLTRQNSDSFDPQYVQPNSVDDPPSYSFTAGLRKTGTPTLQLTGGTMSFAETTQNLQTPAEVLTAVGPHPVSTVPTTVTGADGEYAPTWNYTVVDGNGFEYGRTLTANNNLITIDGLLPIIENFTTVLPTDSDGHIQTAVKNNDTLRFTGTVRDANPDPTGVQIKLRQNNGNEEIIIPSSAITTSGASTGAMSFNANFATAFAASATHFTPVVTAIDMAKNVSETVEGAPVRIDNFIPSIDSNARNVNGETIQDPSIDGGNTAILVNIDENDMTRGGCNTAHWTIAGETLGAKDVWYNNGVRCVAGLAPPEGANANVRILTLYGDSRDRTYETSVTYEPNPTVSIGKDQLKDGASNRAPKGIQNILSGVLPPLPKIDLVERSNGADGREPAVFDQGVYWTRFGGSDLTVTVWEGQNTNGQSAGAVRIGDRLQASTNAACTSWGPMSAPAEENAERLTVPVSIGDVANGAVSSAITRCVRIVGGNGLNGHPTSFQVVLDKATPTLTTASQTGEDQVRVDFSEVIWDGSNSAGMWSAFETDSEGNEYFASVISVTGSRESRTLTVDFPGFGNFSSVMYQFKPSTGSNPRLYVDRAGNPLTEQVTIPAS